jgi:hypothetical protein
MHWSNWSAVRFAAEQLCEPGANVVGVVGVVGVVTVMRVTVVLILHI